MSRIVAAESSATWIGGTSERRRGSSGDGQRMSAARVGDRAPRRRREAGIDVVEELRLELLDGPVVRDERRRARRGARGGEEPAGRRRGAVGDVAGALRDEERADGLAASPPPSRRGTPCGRRPSRRAAARAARRATRSSSRTTEKSVVGAAERRDRPQAPEDVRAGVRHLGTPFSRASSCSVRGAGRGSVRALRPGATGSGATPQRAARGGRSASPAPGRGAGEACARLQTDQASVLEAVASASRVLHDGDPGDASRATSFRSVTRICVIGIFDGADLDARAAEARGVRQVVPLRPVPRSAASGSCRSGPGRRPRTRGRRRACRRGSGSCTRRSGCSAASPRAPASAKIRERPLSRMTRWTSLGPSFSPGPRGPVMMLK